MDMKLLAVVLILVVAAILFARTMRVHANASWGEIAFPWFRDREKSTEQGRHGGPVPAE
jgi:hypothetical protein